MLNWYQRHVDIGIGNWGVCKKMNYSYRPC